MTLPERRLVFARGNGMWPTTRHSLTSFNTVTPFLSVIGIFFKVNAASKKPKVKSLKEAIVILEDVIECLTSENLTETVNDLSKVLSNNYSVRLAESQKRPYRVTDFIKRIRYCASFKNNTILI